MSLPPIPDLIPIVAVVKKKRVKDNNNEGGWRVCAPCAAAYSEEVMSTEERSSSASQQPSTELIDNAQSRGPSAALREPPPQPRRARSERCRHRKSDRRRERRLEKVRASAKQTSPERPQNPRVNPIFVWVRQEDTRIVDVKCEDYDKRNRILLTKTAQGWRAIPRTETLAPLKEADDRTHHHHHHHHRRKSSRKTKVRRRSTAVQVGSDQDDEPPPLSPTWTSPVNVESHLPSHKIHVPGKCLSPKSVNTSVTDDAQTPSECSAKTCDDVSPLDNLLAVAEFEFNQHMQSGEWKSSPHIMEDLIESCKEDQNTSKDYDYTEEDDNDNNLAMDDILTRLEQSLCSPEDEGKPESIPDIDEPIFEAASLHENVDPPNLDLSTLAAHEEDPNIEHTFVGSNQVSAQESLQESINVSMHESIHESMQDSIHESMQEPVHESMQESIHKAMQESIHEAMQEPIHESMQGSNIHESMQRSIHESMQECIQESIQESLQESIQESVQEFEAVQESIQESMQESVQEPNPETGEIEPNLESSEALELVQMSEIENECKPVEPQPTDLSIRPMNFEQPTDLSIPKQTPPRPPSHNSVQSPQPSGIPAVPPSPDTTKSKSIFLESLLTSTSQNIPLNSEVIIIKQKEPLDLGKSRKSASPTVTCSEEVEPPPAKKLKNEDITLKTLLVENEEKPKPEKIETPKLLELLKVDSEPDPLTQLRQLLSDSCLNVPDPMLVPKERLSQIISHPSREIPKLLKQRPELRLPEALAFPHLLQDPDILVITLRQLETIILKQNNQFKEKAKAAGVRKPEKPAPQVQKPQKQQVTSSEPKGFNELAGDIDAATTAAFNQMIWFPYLNQLEASMSFGNPEMLKMLQQPMYQVPKFPPQFPQIPQPPAFTNNFEMNMWQEAMMQANILRPKNPVGDLQFRNYMDKKPQHKKPNIPSWNTPAGYQNFLGTPNMCQPMKQNLVPPYNPLFAEKTRGPQLPLGFPYFPQKQKHHHTPANSMSGATLFHKMEQKQPSSYQRHKPEAKQQPKYQSNRFYGKSRSERKESHHADPSEVKQHQHVQPIDLSGATLASKLGLKPHFIDASSAAAKLLKHDDIPEVGSTTASVEEMQDAHKHLWHPLFGNQKDYHNSWNWSTVTAAGE